MRISSCAEFICKVNLNPLLHDIDMKMQIAYLACDTTFEQHGRILVDEFQIL